MHINESDEPLTTLVLHPVPVINEQCERVSMFMLFYNKGFVQVNGIQATKTTTFFYNGSYTTHYSACTFDGNNTPITFVQMPLKPKPLYDYAKEKYRIQKYGSQDNYRALKGILRSCKYALADK